MFTASHQGLHHVFNNYVNIITVMKGDNPPVSMPPQMKNYSNVSMTLPTSYPIQYLLCICYHAYSLSQYNDYYTWIQTWANFNVYAGASYNVCIVAHTYVLYCMYVYSPLAICIQTTSEGGLAQFTFIANQFNAHSMWIRSIQNNAHLFFVMQASLKYYKEGQCALLSDKALTQRRRAHEKMVTFEQMNI